MKNWIRNSLIALGILGIVVAAPLVGGADLDICIKIPSQHKQRAIDAFVDIYNYPEMITSETGATIPNPQTKGQFSKQQLVEFAKRTIKRSETKTGIEQAQQQVSDDVDSIDIQ